MTRRLLKLACAASLAALAFTCWRAAAYYRGVVASAKGQVRDLTVKGAARIDAELREAMAAVQGVADDLSSGRLARGGVDARLRKTLGARPFLRGANVTFQPVAVTPGWTAPDDRKAANGLAAVYSVPFFRNGKAAGVVSAEISLDEIKRLVEGLDLGPSGFGELISADGTYLYHPRSEYVLARKTIFDLAKEFGDKDRLEIGPRALRGESGLIDHVSTNTGLRSWFLYEPIPAAGWSLQNTFLRADLPYNVDLMRRLLVRVLLSAAAFALLLTGLCLRVEELGRRRLWTLSIVSSLVFASGVAVMWVLALRLDAHAQAGGTTISDRATLARLSERYVKECADRRAEAPVFVPTGVFLETARFVGPSDVQVTGYVWQKYDGTAKGLDRGFALRDAADVTIAEPYRQSEGGVEVLRWPFQALLHEDMHLAEFPLDQETLALRLRRRDLDHNVVLTPDVGSYKILAAAAKPGLAAEFRIPGWRVLKTFFSVQGAVDNTTFGLSRAGKEGFPGLQYNVLLRRNLLDAFISNLGPILIALTLLFALQMVMTSDEKLAAFMQTTSGRVVSICVSMFFVIVFAHISVRRGMAAEEIFYLEYFYFVTYLMILWVALNSIVYYKLKHVSWLQYQENLILKLLFWPVVTGFLFFASVTAFY